RLIILSERPPLVQPETIVVHRQRWVVDAWIGLHGPEQVICILALVGDAHKGRRRELPFDGEVPLLNRGRLHAEREWIRAHRQWKRYGRRMRTRNGKWIYLSDIGIGGTEWEVDRGLDGEWVIVWVDRVPCGLILIHSIAGTDTGLAIAEGVKRNSDPWIEQVIV